MRGLFGLALLCLFCATRAGATTLYELERVCPVGGQTYKSFGIGSTSRFGMRLDMRAVGPQGYLPVVECPNGFVVYKDEKEFTAAEIAKLTPVVEGDAYQRARTEEVVHYRIILLERALGTSDTDLRYLFLRAAFDAEDARREELRQKYLGMAADAYLAYLNGHPEHDDSWWTAKQLTAEIARQRGLFDQAIATIDSVGQATGLPEWWPKVTAQIRARAQARDSAPAAYNGG